jgi:hypothetical protein
MDKTVKRYGRLDVTVNSAGTDTSDPLEFPIKPRSRRFSPHTAEIWAPLVLTTLCTEAADENRGMRPSTSVG